MEFDILSVLMAEFAERRLACVVAPLSSAWKTKEATAACKCRFPDAHRRSVIGEANEAKERFSHLSVFPLAA